MKQQPRWFWGYCFIFGGIFANLAMTLLIQSGELRRSLARESQLGAAIGGGILILVGIVIIILHFVRKRKGQT